MATSQPVSSASATAKPATRASISIAAIRGVSSGNSASTPRTATAELIRPRPPPSSARTVLSVRSWRTRRDGLAPSASRTEISRCRAIPRVSSRFTTLAEAMSKIRPTEPNKSSNAGLTSPTTNSRSGRTVKSAPKSSRVSYLSFHPTTTACSSARACAIVAPGFNRPSPFISADWNVMWSRSNAFGNTTSASGRRRS